MHTTPDPIHQILARIDIARDLRDLGLPIRACAMLACMDRSDPDAIADAIDAAGGDHPVDKTTMEAIGEALDLEIVDRDGDLYIVPQGAAWHVWDDGGSFDLPELALSATDDDLLEELRIADCYDPTDESYAVFWNAEIDLVNSSGRVVEIRLSAEITIEPEEPECADGHEHSWAAPFTLLGGLEENPGVWGHGGGVIIRRVCRHCGTYKVTDTWATNPSDGTPMESVSYEDADDDSRAWVLRCAARAALKDGTAEWRYTQGDDYGHVCADLVFSFDGDDTVIAAAYLNADNDEWDLTSDGCGVRIDGLDYYYDVDEDLDDPETARREVWGDDSDDDSDE